MSPAVLAEAPLRVALGGGGTDLASHYRRHGGFVVSAAIDRVVRVQASPSADGSYVLDHLEREVVADAAAVGHPILRATLARCATGPVTLRSAGDVEPGTGLGSSGAFTVAAVGALHALRGEHPSAAAIAEEACAIEIDDVGRTVGKADQHAAAFGGVNAFSFSPSGEVSARRLALTPETVAAIDERFLLFYTGRSRSAADVLAGQVERSLAGDAALEANLLRSVDLARAGADVLEAGDLDAFGQLMDAQWELKRERLAQVSVPRIDDLRDRARDAGATGVMLMGAGGGGHLLVQAPDPRAMREALAEARAPEVRFELRAQGVTVDPAVAESRGLT